ncbi:hypothetical protein OXX80_001173 [Metschnikowia pulcherrima]
MKTIDYAQLQACLYSRIPPLDFMAHDCSSILDEETQEKVAGDLMGIAETNCYYVRLFLAQYVRMLEKNSAVIDSLYELYCEPRILGAQELPATSEDLLRYAIDSSGAYVTIKETPRVISGAGTTGLRTWEAALFLSNYFNKMGDTRRIFDAKNVLELGTGTGLVSLALLHNYRFHNFRSITLTDGDSALLEKLPETLRLNQLPPEVPVHVRQLIWGEDDIHENETADETSSDCVDVIVAADVTYDASVVPQLCDTLARHFRKGATVAYVAATIRNSNTIEVWEQQLLERFSWTVCADEKNPHESDLRCWFRKGTPEIRVYEICDTSG